MPKMKHAMRVQQGEGIDTIDWGKNSVCEGIVTSLHIHSRFHLLFNDRKLRANNTNNRGKVWWFWGDPTSLFHAMATCSFVLCQRAARWTHFLLRSQTPSLSPEPRTSAHSCPGALPPCPPLSGRQGHMAGWVLNPMAAALWDVLRVPAVLRMPQKLAGTAKRSSFPWICY